MEQSTIFAHNIWPQKASFVWFKPLRVGGGLWTKPYLPTRAGSPYQGAYLSLHGTHVCFLGGGTLPACFSLHGALPPSGSSLTAFLVSSLPYWTPLLFG